MNRSFLALLAVACSAQPVRPQPSAPPATARTTTPSLPRPATSSTAAAASAERAAPTIHTVGGKPGAAPASTKPQSGALYCDDSSDCAAGLACCTTGSIDEVVQLCTPRRGPDSRCASEVCKLNGAACPKGQYCHEGTCVFERHAGCPPGGAHCGKHEYCQWKSGSATCVAEPSPSEQPEDSRSLFGCTRPADCAAGMQCCTDAAEGFHATSCAVNCDLSNTNVICSTVQDCSRALLPLPVEQRRQAKPSCDPVGEDAPPWLKACKLGLP